MLGDLFGQYPEKYGKNLANTYHLMKSLVYFDDAEQSEIPVMLEKISWKVVKETIVKEVKSYHKNVTD